ncbi:hypothetical protein VP01_412g1 [Puccinia sorghi]|uniref:Uncharacterized protein n=1 Tax=Puccinia sorghi TaxID=27349 RepID=A0A0L6UT28_9BASI|nr:hypothetical protein VP01_412g1 [Puccinia sorghi]
MYTLPFYVQRGPFTNQGHASTFPLIWVLKKRTPMPSSSSLRGPLEYKGRHSLALRSILSIFNHQHTASILVNITITSTKTKATSTQRGLFGPTKEMRCVHIAFTLGLVPLKLTNSRLSFFLINKFLPDHHLFLIQPDQVLESYFSPLYFESQAYPSVGSIILKTSVYQLDGFNFFISCLIFFWCLAFRSIGLISLWLYLSISRELQSLIYSFEILKFLTQILHSIQVDEKTCRYEPKFMEICLNKKGTPSAQKKKTCFYFADMGGTLAWVCVFMKFLVDINVCDSKFQMNGTDDSFEGAVRWDLSYRIKSYFQKRMAGQIVVEKEMNNHHKRAERDPKLKNPHWVIRDSDQLNILNLMGKYMIYDSETIVKTRLDDLKKIKRKRWERKELKIQHGWSSSLVAHFQKIWLHYKQIDMIGQDKNDYMLTQPLPPLTNQQLNKCDNPGGGVGEGGSSQQYSSLRRHLSLQRGEKRPNRHGAECGPMWCYDLAAALGLARGFPNWGIVHSPGGLPTCGLRVLHFLDFPKSTFQELCLALWVDRVCHQSFITTTLESRSRRCPIRDTQSPYDIIILCVTLVLFLLIKDIMSLVYYLVNYMYIHLIQAPLFLGLFDNGWA